MKESIPSLTDCMELIERYARMYHGKLKESRVIEIDDLIQEGVVGYLLAKKSFDGERKFTNYLIKTLKNRYLGIVQKSFRSIDQVSMELEPINKVTSYSPFCLSCTIEAMVNIMRIHPNYVRSLFFTSEMFPFFSPFSHTFIRTKMRSIFGLTAYKAILIERKVREGLLS